MEDSTDTLAQMVIYVVILFLTLYAVALGSHWFKYGANRKTSLTAMFIFLAGSGILVIGLATAYNLF